LTLATVKEAPHSSHERTSPSSNSSSSASIGASHFGQLTIDIPYSELSVAD
jgi:hypothetical protein